MVPLEYKIEIHLLPVMFLIDLKKKSWKRLFIYDQKKQNKKWFC